MATHPNSVTFVVNETGEVSGESFHGTFTMKLRLSHMDQFKRDEIRRRLLGADSEHASPRAANAAMVFSEIMIHLTDSPTWWKGNNDGLDLEDDNVVAAVFNGIMAEKKKYTEAMTKKAEEAKEALKKTDLAK